MLGGTLTKTGIFDPFLETNPDAFGSIFSSTSTASLDGFGPGDYSANYTGTGDRVYWGPSGGSDVKPPAAVSRTHPNLSQPHVGPGFAVQAALATTDSSGTPLKSSAPQQSARTGAVAPPGSEASAPVLSGLRQPPELRQPMVRDARSWGPIPRTRDRPLGGANVLI